MTEHAAGTGPRRQLIDRVAAFVEKLPPPRGLGLKEPCSPLLAVPSGGGDPDVLGGPGSGAADVFFDPPSVPMRAFTLSDGSFYGPGDRDCASGLAVAMLSVCQRDGIDVSDALAAGEAAAAAGKPGDERSLEVALGVDAGTAEALARGSGTLRQWCPPEAVTGSQMAVALRSAADGMSRHQVWSDALLEVAPEHHDGPTVDPTAFVDPQAFVARDVVVDRDAYVGGGAVLLAGTRVGPGCRVDDGAVVGPGTELGEGVWVGSDAHVRSARLGDGGVVEDRASSSAPTCRRTASSSSAASSATSATAFARCRARCLPARLPGPPTDPRPNPTRCSIRFRRPLCCPVPAWPRAPSWRPGPSCVPVR